MKSAEGLKSGVLILLDRIFEVHCLSINKKPLFIQMFIYCIGFLRRLEGGSRAFPLPFASLYSTGVKGKQAETRQQTTQFTF